jgi:hypothetical protein
VSTLSNGKSALLNLRKTNKGKKELHHHLMTVLQRLRQMCGLDLFAPCQICNRRPHQTLTFSLQPPKSPNLPGAHIDVVDNIKRIVL